MVSALTPPRLALPRLGGLDDEFDLTPEEERSLLSELASATLGGVATVGNVLDIPAAAIRGGISALQTGEGRHLAAPFYWSGKEEQSGRRILERAGVLGPNTPGLDWGDVGGFALEVALDPLTYATFGTSAVAKMGAGGVAKSAGLLDDATRVASKLTGRSIGTIGPRESRMLVKLKDLARHADDPVAAVEKLRTAAQSRGVNLMDVWDEPLGGLMGVGPPFGEARFTLGREGGLAQTVARKMDTLGRAIRHGALSPVRPIANLFDAGGWGMQSLPGRMGSQRMFGAKQEAAAAAKGFSNTLYEHMTAAGLASDDKIDDAIRLLEGTANPRNAAEAAMVQTYRQAVDRMPAEAADWGFDITPLQDPQIKYMFRQLSHAKRLPDGSMRVFATHDPSDLARAKPLVDVAGGTPTIRKAAMDPDVNAAIGAGQTTKQVAQLIDRKFPGAFPDSEGFADILQSVDAETRAVGLFGNFPAFDAEARLFNHGARIASAREVVKTLADPGLLKVPSPAIVKDTISVQTLFRRTGMNDTDGAYVHLAEALGVNYDPAIRQLRVPKDVAEDVTRLYERFTKPPTDVKLPMAGWDTLSNWWKALQTGPWPGFIARNVTSGQVQEALRGSFQGKYFRAVNALVRGGVAKGLTDHPLVVKLARQRGIIGPITDEQASRLARQLMRQYGVVQKYAGEALQRTGPAGAAEGRTALDFAEQMLGGGLEGGRGVSFASAARKFAGRAPGTTLNPLKGTVRGAVPLQEVWQASKGQMPMSRIQPAMESTFGPVVAGEEMGHWVEALNRAPGWLAETAMGVDPMEAARRVGAAQVEYGAAHYTPFEQALTRLFPFYKFGKGQAKYVAKTLTEKPGGGLAQLLRATNLMRGSEQAIPQYLAETLSIPIPEGTPLIGPQPGGDRRFVTGFSLMHEDPLSFLGGGLRGGLGEAASRLNPMVKAPLEWAAGESFFQRGPFGGRELTDLDPTMGRIIANVAGLDEPVRFPPIVEQAVANSPFSRLTTTVRTLTDPRKRIDPDVPIPGPAALMNVFTGARISDVPQKAEEAILREATMERLAETGKAKIFEKMYVPKETLAGLPPEEARELLISQAMLKMLAERAKKRAKGETLEPLGVRSW